MEFDEHDHVPVHEGVTISVDISPRDCAATACDVIASAGIDAHLIATLASASLALGLVVVLLGITSRSRSRRLDEVAGVTPQI
ncbi:hypothetical protein ATC03_14815 [Agromyces aureus]|uniref:Uncharacterized protein n=1 Tax=Agromyces aureus TaxID=453304 RepID=A0A191WHU4_9MICO|nr:hypothetical protein ATC03_14815 [Agromyces aureus]